MSVPLFRRRRAVGIAIGATTVIADVASAAGTAPWSRAIAALPEKEARWPALAEALRELRKAVRTNGAELSVALLPPLAEVRLVTLPPLAADEARRAITRNAARYFLTAREPQVIGLVPAPRRAEPKSRTVAAAAAAARVIEAVHTAAQEAGWELGTIVPAEAAWHAAALAIWPPLRRGTHEVAIVRHDRAEVLQLEDGVLTGLRRVPGSGQAAGLSARHDDGSSLAVPAKRTALAQSPELAAAAFASRGTVLELVSESAWQRRRAGQAKLAMAVAIAAVVLLAVAAGLELWGVRRELEHLQRERAALRPKVAALVATRDLAAATGQRLNELAQANRAAVPWSDFFVTLTKVLPRDAYLTAVRAAGDSVVLEGLAGGAAGVFSAIEAAQGLSGVHSAAPVRRDLRNPAGANALERFSLAVRVTPDGGDTSAAFGLGTPRGGS
jgi:Tfp pilus assembly protein PilN